MKKIAVALACAGTALATPAQAAVALFTFTATEANLGTGPYGTVTVTENAGALDFLVSLASGYKIHDTTAANHLAFTFKLLDNPAVSITDLTAGFKAVSPLADTNVTSPPFGTYFTGIDCDTACGPGYNGGYAGTLSFKVSATSSLDLKSLAFNTVAGKDIYFTTDVVSRSDTGNVGAILTSITGGSNVPPVPEPATWAMMLVGFGAIGTAMRRRRAPAMHFDLA